MQLYGLTWKITPYYVDQPEPGIVLGQDPVAGDEVEKGSIVELFVSEAPRHDHHYHPPPIRRFPQHQIITFTTTF